MASGLRTAFPRPGAAEATEGPGHAPEPNTSDQAEGPGEQPVDPSAHPAPEVAIVRHLPSLSDFEESDPLPLIEAIPAGPQGEAIPAGPQVAAFSRASRVHRANAPRLLAQHRLLSGAAAQLRSRLSQMEALRSLEP